jgi:GTP-binding protein
MNFVDKVRVTAKAGKGGDGALSFRREKYVEFGGPDGGYGGKGGDITFVATRNLGTLLDFSRRPRLLAGDGKNGKGANKTGEGADDMVVEVPLGTVVFKNDKLLADLVKEGDRVEKGRQLGRSGMTGLAAGDHLHFTMLVNGHPVNPVEWWDPKWMQDRVLRKISEAGGV